MGIEPDFLTFLENFGRRLIYETREECARVCDNVSIDLIDNCANGSDAANHCAEVIRLLNNGAE